MGEARRLLLMDAPTAPKAKARACVANAGLRPALRLLTCGSIDAGKSTLIERLLGEQNLIYADHLAALERDSINRDTTDMMSILRCCSMVWRPNTNRELQSTLHTALFRPNIVR